MRNWDKLKEKTKQLEDLLQTDSDLLPTLGQQEEAEDLLEELKEIVEAILVGDK